MSLAGSAPRRTPHGHDLSEEHGSDADQVVKLKIIGAFTVLTHCTLQRRTAQSAKLELDLSLSFIILSMPR